MDAVRACETAGGYIAKRLPEVSREPCDSPTGLERAAPALFKIVPDSFPATPECNSKFKWLTWRDAVHGDLRSKVERSDPHQRSA